MQDRTPEKIEDLATAEKPEKARRQRKPKAIVPNQTVEPKFPTEGKINNGFIYLDSDALTALGLGKGVEQKIRIDLTPEGSLVIRKL